MDCSDEITVRERKNKVGNGVFGTKLFLKHQLQNPKGAILHKIIGFEFWHSKSHNQSHNQHQARVMGNRRSHGLTWSKKDRVDLDFF